MSRRGTVPNSSSSVRAGGPHGAYAPKRRRNRIDYRAHTTALLDGRAATLGVSRDEVAALRRAKVLHHGAQPAEQRGGRSRAWCEPRGQHGTDTRARSQRRRQRPAHAGTYTPHTWMRPPPPPPPLARTHTRARAHTHTPSVRQARVLAQMCGVPRRWCVGGCGGRPGRAVRQHTCRSRVRGGAWAAWQRGGRQAKQPRGRCSARQASSTLIEESRSSAMEGQLQRQLVSERVRPSQHRGGGDAGCCRCCENTRAGWCVW